MSVLKIEDVTVVCFWQTLNFLTTLRIGVYASVENYSVVVFARLYFDTARLIMRNVNRSCVAFYILFDLFSRMNVYVADQSFESAIGKLAIALFAF